MKRKQTQSNQMKGISLILAAVLPLLPAILVAQSMEGTDNPAEAEPRGGIVEIQTPISTEFGTYVPYRVPAYQPTVGYGESGLRADLSNVVAPQGGFTWERYFSASERGGLARDRVVLRPEQMGSFAQAYARTDVQPEFAPFVTTDAVMAGLRATIDETYRRAQRDQLTANLQSVLATLSRSVDAARANESDPVLKDGLHRLLAWIETGRLLLDPSASPQSSVADDVRAELRKIEAGTSATSGILPDRRIDYGVLIPTGHYTINPELENYYRAKVWLSRIGLQIRAENGALRATEARMAMIFAQMFDMMKEGDKNRLNDVVAIERFFAGRDANALMPDALAAAMQAYYGFQYGAGLSYLAGANAIERLVAYVERSLPQSMSAGQSLSMQILPRETALSSAFFATVRRIPGTDQGEYGKTLFAALLRPTANESKEIRALRSTLARFPMEDWVQDLEWTTLYTSHILAGEDEASTGLPKFVQSAAWKERKLSSGLGAWSAVTNEPGQLALSGGSAGANETTAFTGGYAAGYVEPDPVAWSAIASQVRYIRDGLKNNTTGSFVDAPLEEKLRDIENSAAQFARIADLELRGKALAPEQSELIASMPEHIAAWETFIDPSLRGKEILLTASAPIKGGTVNAATGHPVAIYVIVPDPEDPRTLTLVRGAVYSYYETTQGEDEWIAAATTGNSSASGPYVVQRSAIRNVEAVLSHVTASAQETDRNGVSRGVQVVLEANVVRRSSGAVWYTITAPGYDGADVITTVVDASGREIFQSFPLPIENGQRYDMVPTDDLKSGHYFIRVNDITGRTLASGRFLLVQ